LLYFLLKCESLIKTLFVASFSLHHCFSNTVVLYLVFVNEICTLRAISAPFLKISQLLTTAQSTRYTNLPLNRFLVFYISSTYVKYAKKDIFKISMAKKIREYEVERTSFRQRQGTGVETRPCRGLIRLDELQCTSTLHILEFTSQSITFGASLFLWMILFYFNWCPTSKISLRSRTTCWSVCRSSLHFYIVFKCIIRNLPCGRTPCSSK